MRVLVVGSGGREHAIVRKLKENKTIDHIICAPGNGGIAADAECVDIKATDVEAMTEYAASNDIDFVVVTPDDPLALGMVDAIEAKIKALWADVPERANRGERPLYSVDDNDEPIVAIVTDKEAQQTRIQLYWKHPQTPIYMQCTNMSYLLDRCRNLIRQMLDTRFEEAAMKPDAPYVGAGAGYFELVKLRDAFTAIAVAKEGKETEAYAALLYELEKMRRYGFTESELEIAKANMLSEFEKAYNSRQTRKNIAYAREYIRHFEDNEPIPGIEFEYEFVQQMLPLISLDMINSIAQEQLMGDKNIIVCITGVDKEGVNIPSEQQAVEMLRAMPDLAIEAPVSEKIDRPLVAKLPKKGKIKKQSANASLGTTEWLLNNGIRVIFKTTDFRHDQILMETFSPGGLSCRSALCGSRHIRRADVRTRRVQLHRPAESPCRQTGQRQSID